MVTGFAEGFRSGYGMVENTIERRQQQKNRDEDIARSLSLREEDLAREERIRGEDRERDEERYQKELKTQAEATKEATRQFEERIGFDREKLAADQARQDTDDAKLKILQANAQKEKERADKFAGLESAAIAAQKLLDYQNISRNFTEDELRDIEAQFNIISGTGLDMTDGLNLFTPELSDQIQADLQKIASGEDLSNLDSIKGGLNLVLRDNNRRLIGQKITPDAFPNAPKELQTGEYTVVETEVYDVKGRVEDSGDQFLDADVLVTVRDRDGNLLKYIAPMTEGRQGTGAQYSFKVNEISTAFAAKQFYNTEVLQNRDKLLDLVAANQFATERGTFDRQAYNEAFREAEESFFQNLDANRSSTIVQGGRTTYGDLATNKRLRDNFIRQQVLIGGESQGRRLPEVNAQISSIRNTPQVRNINAELRNQNKEELSPKEILRLSLLLSIDDNEKLFMDRNSAETYKQILRDKLGTPIGVNTSSRTPTGGTGTLPTVSSRRDRKSFSLSKYLFD
ncbi:MAG: hypothetical protein CMC89_05105 [Flavobacteriaceae bacterium]|nr:hypothetical protein [Flavobacteriaceae bacterium]|tara:strand:- start:1725 stop:3260 length:1536 start_codon:yes stop_codon:yes gene_type:complete